MNNEIKRHLDNFLGVKARRLGEADKTALQSETLVSFETAV